MSTSSAARPRSSRRCSRSPAAPNLRFDRVQNAAPYVSGSDQQGEAGESGEASYSVHAGGGALRILPLRRLRLRERHRDRIDLQPSARIGRTTYRQAGSGAAGMFNRAHVDTTGTPRRTTSSNITPRASACPNGERSATATTPPICRRHSTVPSIGRTGSQSNLGYHIAHHLPAGRAWHGDPGTRPATATLYASAAPDDAAAAADL